MMYDKLVTFVMAMVPVFELRLSIPWAIHKLNLDWSDAFLFSILGNAFIALVLIVIIYYFTVERIKNFINEIPIIGFIFKKWENSSVKKSQKIEKWGYTGLMCFVAIPLPITGAWTAVLISFFLDLKKIKTFIAIALGLLISATIVSTVSVYAPEALVELGWLSN